jgi:hypothetical protein
LCREFLTGVDTAAEGSTHDASEAVARTAPVPEFVGTNPVKLERVIKTLPVRHVNEVVDGIIHGLFGAKDKSRAGEMEDPVQPGFGPVQKFWRQGLDPRATHRHRTEVAHGLEGCRGLG